MTNSRFEALGVFLPSTVLSTPDLVARVHDAPEFDLERITGVRERRVVDTRPESSEDSFTLAMDAARDCLGNSRYAAADLDVVISASITRFKDGGRFHFEPSFASMIARELGATQAVQFDVSNACAGMMTGVYLLDRMIRAGVVRNGMVVSGEQATAVSDTAAAEISDSYDPQFASLSVGDSAAAVIMDEAVDEADRIHYIELMTCAEYSHLCIGMPSDRTEGIALYTDNKQMHKENRIRMWPTLMGDILDHRGTDFAAEGFDHIIQHQVSGRAVRFFNQVGEDMFGTPMPDSPTVVEDLGNTATTSHFLVLHQALRDKHVAPGAKVLFVPAASGVVTGCLSATISSLDV